MITYSHSKPQDEEKVLVWCRKLLVEGSDLNLKENITNKNCPYCRYDNIVAFVMKHTTSNRPVEEYIPVNFCPKCGANLTEYLNDRFTY